MKEPSAAIMSVRGDVCTDSELYDYYCWRSVRCYPVLLPVESEEGMRMAEEKRLTAGASQFGGVASQ